MRKTISLALLATLCITSNANADEKLRKIVLDNNTESDRHIKVYDKNGEKLFDKDVGDDEKFTIRGKGDDGALGDEIDIHLDGEYYTTISTGCTHVKVWEEIDMLEVEEIATIPCKDDNSKDDYDEGWDDGYDPGFEEGKDDACEKKAHNIDEEFDDDGIYDKGWEKGYTFGYEKGWKSCDRDEYQNGYDDIWDAGYDSGAEEAQADVNAGKPYHIDEEFSNESHYDRGWKEGYRKGYDYFYGKKTFPKYIKGVPAVAVTEDKKYAAYIFRHSHNVLKIFRLDDMVEVYSKGYWNRYGFRDLHFIGNDKISYTLSRQANATPKIISFLEEE